ncbi:MAG: hypothetical protein R6V75_08385 [Bacteroidales bacterium]
MKKSGSLGVAAVSVLILLVAGSCNLFPDYPRSGLTEEIREMVPDSVLSTLGSLKMPLNLGDTPPDIEGTFLASPFVLNASNRKGDLPGQVFSNYQVTFYEIADAEPRLKMNYTNGPESGYGVESLISGKNQDFTVFARLVANYNGYPADLLHIVSGTLVENGVRDLFFASVVMNNFDNPGRVWLENGQCRVCFDSDSFSPMITPPIPFGRRTGPSVSTLLEGTGQLTN